MMAEFGWHKVCNELRELLNQPLPGGRGFQAARDKQIQLLAHTLAVDCEPPTLDGRDSRYFARQPIFLNHNCWACKEGQKPCREGNYNSCSYPHARND